MKHTCDKCGQTIDVPERDILAYAQTSGAFRARLESLLAKLRGSKGGSRSLTTMTAQQRSDRARKAVAAREAKRAAVRAG